MDAPKVQVDAGPLPVSQSQTIQNLQKLLRLRLARDLARAIAADRSSPDAAEPLRQVQL